jgi:hypothetical protein
MASRPSTPEIITVNSEALQTAVRDLLPSQNGFGSELQASNVITPIINLTPTAEGSTLPSYLQTALAFGSNTAFAVRNSSSNLATSAGFYQVSYNAIMDAPNAVGATMVFSIDDGFSNKNVYTFSQFGTSASNAATSNGVLTFWVRPGDTLIATSNDARCVLSGSTRQVASSDGTLVQPQGYPS